MKSIKYICWATLLLSAALPSNADVLELKTGKTLNGKFVGGTAGTIRFETAEGVQVVETSQALALTFTGGGAAGAAATQTAPAAPAAAPAPVSVTIPAGTELLVRMVDPVSSKDPQGKRFTTTLEIDLAVNGVIVAKAGTKVYGRIQSAQQARRYTGQSSIDLRLTEVALGPNLVPLVSSGYTDAGDRSIKKTAKGAAAGAAIGAAASGVKKGQSVTVSPGALLAFKLQQPLTVTVTK
jgi:hypothetical protein